MAREDQRLLQVGRFRHCHAVCGIATRFVAPRVALRQVVGARSDQERICRHAPVPGQAGGSRVGMGVARRPAWDAWPKDERRPAAAGPASWRPSPLSATRSGGHGTRTRNPFRGTTFPVWPLAIRLPSEVAGHARRPRCLRPSSEAAGQARPGRLAKHGATAARGRILRPTQASCRPAGRSA